MYELHTLGGGRYLVDLLNAVAAITSGGAFLTLAQLAGVAGLAWILFRTAFGGSWKDNAKWMLAFIAIWGALVVPKATVRVVDRIDPALAPAVVANVPIGLALFASITSQVGEGLTELTEQAFALPDDLTYRRHGLIFGARLAAEATRLEVTDQVFARNLRAYGRQCVFHALLLGHLTADELRESPDVWRLVTAPGSPSTGASPARMVELATRTGGVVTTEIVTCAEAAGRLDAMWNPEITRAGAVHGRRIFPGSQTDALARTELMAALPAAHDWLIGASRSAADILRQQMTLNALHNAGEQWAAESGNAAALRAYTDARAEAQTASAYRAIGRQAETWVPMLRIVFECLFIGAFPMAVLLMLTPAGGTIFRSYISGLVWLQSWGPLYAILHRISMGEAAERMSAVAAMPSGEAGIALVAQAGIRAVAADVAVMSGYLSMSVPFLAAALAYGIGKATMLATSVLAVGQEAASSAAHEGTTGNVSLANTQADTHRFATLEGRQLRTSLQVDQDRYTGFAPRGAAFTVAGDGTPIMDGSAATSRIPASGVRLSESLSQSYETRAAEAREQAGHWQTEAATAQTAALTNSTAMVERLSHDVSTGTAHARGITESQSEQVQLLRDHVSNLSETGGITQDQAAILLGEARFGLGLGSMISVGANGRVTWRDQTIEAEAWNRMKAYTEQNQLHDLWSQVEDASRRYHAASGDSRMTSLEESHAASLSRAERFSEQAALSHREAESWSEQAAEIRTDAQAIDRELGQPFFHWLTERPGADGRAIGEAGAMRLASPQTPEDAEELRAHAAAFVREAFPMPPGPDPESISGLADYRRESGAMAGEQAAGLGTTHMDGTAGIRDRASGAGVPDADSVTGSARTTRAETEADLVIHGAGREARRSVTEDGIRDGRAGVATELDRDLGERVIERLPFGGEWLAGQIYGSAKNGAPDEDTGKDRNTDRGQGPASP